MIYNIYKAIDAIDGKMCLFALAEDKSHMIVTTDSLGDSFYNFEKLYSEWRRDKPRLERMINPTFLRTTEDLE